MRSKAIIRHPLITIVTSVLLLTAAGVSLLSFWFEVRLTAEDGERHVLFIGIESGCVRVVRDSGSTYLNHWEKAPARAESWWGAVGRTRTRDSHPSWVLLPCWELIVLLSLLPALAIVHWARSRSHSGHPSGSPPGPRLCSSPLRTHFLRAAGLAMAVALMAAAASFRWGLTAEVNNERGCHNQDVVAFTAYGEDGWIQLTWKQGEPTLLPNESDWGWYWWGRVADLSRQGTLVWWGIFPLWQPILLLGFLPAALLARFGLGWVLGSSVRV